MRTPSAPGERIELDGTLNLRDIGGWAADGGVVRRGLVFRSDRLSTLSDDDLGRLDDLGIATVIDLRYHAEVAADPSRLWSAVSVHLEIPIGGRLAEQGSLIDRAFAGELDEISVDDVADSYLTMLADHGTEFGRAVDAVLDGAPALYHCTAGKDRTGLLTMLLFKTVGVADEAVLVDFERSNRYRAEVRVEQLRSTFADAGLDVERFRPGLSAPRPAMEAALAWIEAEHGGAEGYLADVGGVTQPRRRLRAHLLDTT
ncbi:MAG: tyrosine-protein phosphatase [Actinomycetota bacterium]